jgi:hypothetical protein
MNCTGGVVVIMLTQSVVDHGLEQRTKKLVFAASQLSMQL